MTIDKDSSLKELLDALENRADGDGIRMHLDNIKIYIGAALKGVDLSAIQKEYLGQTDLFMGFILESLGSMRTIVQWARDKIEGEKDE